MPRLRNKNSGAIVSVSDEKVSRMGAEWELADRPEPKKAPAAKKAAPKSNDK